MLYSPLSPILHTAYIRQIQVFLLNMSQVSCRHLTWPHPSLVALAGQPPVLSSLWASSRDVIINCSLEPCGQRALFKPRSKWFVWWRQLVYLIVPQCHCHDRAFLFRFAHFSPLTFVISRICNYNKRLIVLQAAGANAQQPISPWSVCVCLDKR